MKTINSNKDMDRIGLTIGKYKILRIIGTGGMATVYEAEHKVLGTSVALKVLNPYMSANNQIRERFKNEAKIMGTLNHPNITKVIDFEESENTLAIAMELLQGIDLNQVIITKGKLDFDTCKNIFKQVLSACQYAHEKGILHRDIKPSNIFILPDGTIKILDFGIAKLYGQGNEMTMTGTQIGTPIYMSPEQVKSDKSIDHRSDIYSIGVTLYFTLKGNPPYDVTTMSQFDIFNKIVFETFPNLNREEIGDQLIKRACEKDRELRFQTCSEFLKTLNEQTSIEQKLEEIINKPTINSTTKKSSKLGILAFILSLILFWTIRIPFIGFLIQLIPIYLASKSVKYQQRNHNNYDWISYLTIFISFIFFIINVIVSYSRSY